MLAAAERCGYVAFGQYTPRPGWRQADQRGYVWLGFDALLPAAQLQHLGGLLLLDADLQAGAVVECRCHHAITRLPLARHAHTGRFGTLLLPGQIIAIDGDPLGTRIALLSHFVQNDATRVPVPSSQPVRAAAARPAIDQIGAFNASHDLHALLASYGARRATRSLYYCPFHPDTHASLRVFVDGALSYAQCLSRNSDCPLSIHRRNDAFNVYCIGEGLDARAALHRWQGDSRTRK